MGAPKFLAQGPAAGAVAGAVATSHPAGQAWLASGLGRLI
jgi:hypothetical protein